MTARAVMIQGTASDVGKSVVVAGVCRAAQRRGIRVAPFKPQNMSNNAAACADGGEIGRAQSVQARAAGVPPRTDLSPVLLKPQMDRGSRVVVRGRPVGMLHASDYRAGRARLMNAVMASFARLVAEFDLVIVEGAGSPGEVNLRAGDIANMGFARRAEVPACLVGDIDRGGVIAAVVGTGAVLEAADRALIAGFLKLRGNPALFEDGVRIIERHTGWPCFGVIPWEPAALRLPAEDAASLPPAGRPRGGRVRIAARPVRERRLSARVAGAHRGRHRIVAAVRGGGGCRPGRGGGHSVCGGRPGRAVRGRGPAERGYRPNCVSGCAFSSFSSRASPATMK